MRGAIWTPQALAALAKLSTVEAPSSAVAAELTRRFGVTYSTHAVKNKRADLGLPRPAPTQKVEPRKPRRARVLAAPPPLATTKDTVVKVAVVNNLYVQVQRVLADNYVDAGEVWDPLPNTHPMDIMDLTRTSCRWPLREGKYCGGGAVVIGDKTMPYCREHLKAAYSKIKSR